MNRAKTHVKTKKSLKKVFHMRPLATVSAARYTTITNERHETKRPSR